MLPRGPVAAPPGFGWYDIAGVGGGRGPDATFLESLELLDDLLDTVCAEHGKDRATAVVAGFSQGAALTVALGLRRTAKARPAAMLAMSAYLPEIDGLEYDWEAAELQAALVQHGTEDPLIPVERGRALARTLEEHGVPVVYGEYPMAHQVALESVQQAHGAAGRSAPAGCRRSRSPRIRPSPWSRRSRPRRSTRRCCARRRRSSSTSGRRGAGPAVRSSPIVEQIAAMRPGSYKVVKVNIDEEPSLAQTYDVQSIPLIGLFRNGRLERASLGPKPRPQLEAELGMLVIP